MNLIHDRWIPVDRKSGPGQLIAPWEITDPTDPVLRLAAPRPDFNGALIQFLIGLLQTMCAPEDEESWADWIEQPPTPAQLLETLNAYASAFNLDGEHPRFMQDHSLLYDPKIAELPISNLLIDTNETHFNKPGRVTHTCPSCTAMALFSLQINSPEGGRGHYTSLRGGGPLTSLVVLEDAERSPWRDLWVNVLSSRAFYSLNAASEVKAAYSIFPWLTPERFIKASTGRDVYPVDIAAEQIFWTMPRRIYLNKTNDSSICDLCGIEAADVFGSYLNRPAGISYTNEPVWRHPFSPRYPTDKQGTNKAFRHPRAGGITYKLWPSLVLDGYENDELAEVVRHFQFHRRRLDEFEQARLHVFGYDVKKNKALCWYETMFPMYHLEDAIRETFTHRVNSLVNAASGTSDQVDKLVKEAWFKRPGDAKGDTAFLVEAFLNHTETRFFAQLKELIDQLGSGGDGRDSLYAWHGVLRRSALELFDYWTDRGDFETVDPRRIVEARRKLTGWLNSRNKGLPKMLGITLDKEKAA